MSLIHSSKKIGREKKRYKKGKEKKGEIRRKNYRIEGQKRGKRRKKGNVHTRSFWLLWRMISLRLTNFSVKGTGLDLG